MDYTFGFDKNMVDTLGAKVAVFEGMKDYFVNNSDVKMHPYVSVTPDADLSKMAEEAREMHNGKYFVVRSGSRYEMLPGTSGMNNSMRFVARNEIEAAIEAVRKTSFEYETFIKSNELTDEEVLPVSIHPMVAESFGFATGHPNRDMIMVDYHEGNDRKDKFQSSAFEYSVFGDDLSEFDRSMSRLRYAGDQKPHLFYENGSILEMEESENKEMMLMAKDVFIQLSEFAGKMKEGYKWIMEYGPDPETGKPIVYQLKPFKKIEKADKFLDEADTNMVFGVCSDLVLPVTRVYNPIHEDHSFKDSEFMDDDSIFSIVGNLELVSQFQDKSMLGDMVKEYGYRIARSIKRRYGDDVCLASTYYKKGNEIDFTHVKPKAAIILDHFRSGMQHNRTNLIQSTDIVTFGTGGNLKAGDTVKINSDGVNATVDKI